MYDIKKIFAKNIKRLRKERNLTQEQFAEIVGVQWKTVVNFEAGRNLANSENIQNICNKLNISPYELFLTSNEEKCDIKNQINCELEKLNTKELKRILKIIKALNND